ncbi:unnamed protein product [Acanthoscelides obtectus]|uniref:Uncharacterized protein n=1 Tax=Acanthoscelides obtectus TaxID=200917 RepID=A0A9P0KYJ5_ACAOB|nr:unnamed protein product [Acanthoscelides obtectus]CAK1680901.1 hypothetical protein AOBTE_LOCUS32931 [Acanthoscelides obtectus]
MPIDKFGRHMLRSKKTDTAAIFSTFLRSNLSSVCVVPIYSSTSSEQFYTFNDNSKDYIVPVTEIVDSINVPPKVRVTIGLNSLTDNTPITKGDILHFFTSKEPRPEQLIANIVMRCPLIQQ